MSFLKNTGIRIKLLTKGQEQWEGQQYEMQSNTDGQLFCFDNDGEEVLRFYLEDSTTTVDSHEILKIKLDVNRNDLATEIFSTCGWVKVEGLAMSREPLSALANGYNCWSDSPMLKKNEILFKETDPNQKYFGDAQFYKYGEQAGSFHAWSYTILDHGPEGFNSLIAGLCEDRFYHVIEVDLNRQTYNLLLDIEGFDVTRLEEFSNLLGAFFIPTDIYPETPLYRLFDIWFSEMVALEIVKREYKNQWSGVTPVTGYTSWYNKFTNISQKWLLEHIESIVDKTGWKIFQVDDGYQSCVGDWLTPSPSFPDSVDFVIRKARSAGLIPGVWIAPFVAMEFSNIVKSSPEIILRDSSGHSVVCGDFPHWGGKFLALDTECKKFKSWMESIISHFSSVGVKFIKADFLYASSMLSRKGMSKSEISSRAHQWLYDLCKSYGMYLLSCGAQMSSAYGRCDFSRVGADVAIEWEAPELTLNKSRERPSVKASMTNTITRSVLNSLMFYNDPDVVILREENNMLSHEEKITLTKLNRDLGGLVFSSDSPHLFGESQFDLLSVMEKSSTNLKVKSLGRLDDKNHTYWLETDQKKIAVSVGPRSAVNLLEV